MDELKRKRLKEKGWISTTVDELFGLTPEESAYVALKLSLSNYLKTRRKESDLTQTKLAPVNRGSLRWRRVIPQFPLIC